MVKDEINFFKLGIGPMSEEVVEAVFRYSDLKSIPLMLIASKNQIDWDGGYVNNWDTKRYSNFLALMKKKYEKSNVLICRDHCGPGFKSVDTKDVYKTIDCDIENNFDLIHVDFSKHCSNHREVLTESKRAIEYIKKANSKILIEVGTDENTGSDFKDIKKIKKEVDFFTSISPIMFYVTQTGSLVKEINQVGKFELKYTQEISKLLKDKDLRLKEHNADYFSDSDLKRRARIIDALNIAPCLGVLQTVTTIEYCNIYGIKHDSFLVDAYGSRKWKKWLYKNNSNNKMLCSLVAGHYVFSNYPYRRIYDAICRFENFREVLINVIMKHIDHYVQNFTE